MENQNLPEAIRIIQSTAVNAAEPKLVQVAVSDGAGGAREIPCVVLPGIGGSAAIHPLLSLVREGESFVEQLRLAKADGPDKRTGTAQHQSLLSFIAHANRFKAKHSAVWANPAKRELVSVLDYHPEGADSKPRWGRHRGVYACPLSEAWKAWGGGTPITLGQDDFAALLDSRDRELASGKLPGGGAAPDPSALVTLANSLEVFSTSTAKRERDPNTGRLKLSFSEEKGPSGTLAIPSAFLIHIPVFQDGNPDLLEVRLRLAVADGEAKFTVQIHAADDVLRGAFAWLCQRVSDDTELPTFVGTPE